MYDKQNCYFIQLQDLGESCFREKLMYLYVLYLYLVAYLGSTKIYQIVNFEDLYMEFNNYFKEGYN